MILINNNIYDVVLDIFFMELGYKKMIIILYDNRHILWGGQGSHCYDIGSDDKLRRLKLKIVPRRHSYSTIYYVFQFKAHH